MIKIQRILLATDFSACSHHAMRYACELADTFDADLHLITVFEPPSMAFADLGLGHAGFESAEQVLVAEAAKKLHAIPGSIWHNKLNITRTVRTGRVFVEIVRYAKEQDIDLLIMGTHGRSAISHMLMGSTAERVVRQAPCPVLTMPPEGHEFDMP